VPIRPPALDDRTFSDLTDELLARIPAHTPEWTNPQLGDPGRTIVELFAWLTDALLYRVNLIPERQRLAFLRLLGAQMQAAVPATGIVALQFKDDQATGAQILQPLATVKGPVNFETKSEVTVLPLTCKVHFKRPLTADETASVQDLLPGLAQLYGIPSTGTPRPYAASPLFPNGEADPVGWDLTSSTDGAMWIALLAPKDLLPKVRSSIAGQLLTVGIVPAVEVPALFEAIGPRGRIPHVWEITTPGRDPGVPALLALDVIEDSTGGLRTTGTERLALPRVEFIGAPSNDVRVNLNAGVGPDQPPRIDDLDEAAMIVAWLRLRPTTPMHQLTITWAGINAVQVEQLQTLTGRIVGQSDGSSDQEMQLPATSVEQESFVLQVEEPGLSFVTWQRVDDLAAAGTDARAYTLDTEAGVVRFGNGLRGKIPENQQRVRVAQMRAGGGKAGNLPAGSLTDITGLDASNNAVQGTLKVIQTMATQGGDDSETLAQAEQRIPALFRHNDRAVTEEDYQRIATETPGVNIARVILMPRFKPQQKQFNVPGVVSVMVLPQKSPVGSPNPRADRPTLEAVHGWLSVRTPVATELYVIGCDYVPVSVTVGVTLLDGVAQETTLAAIRDAVRLFLWPLTGGGTDGLGWKLGRSVRDRELDVIVARVPGVDTVNGVNLFQMVNGGWQSVSNPGASGPVEIPLRAWQLPELLHVSVVADTTAPTSLDPATQGTDGASDVAIPVVPEVC